MSTLRELASESIGKITRRTLEPQIEQADGATERGEKVLALAPGQDAGAGILVVVTDRRVLLSRGAPFARPVLTVLPRRDLAAAAADDDGHWRLDLDHPGGRETVRGLADRDARRLAALLAGS